MTVSTEPITPQPDDSGEQENAFLEFAATLPETADGFLDGAVVPPSGTAEASVDGSSSVAGDTVVPPERKRVNVSKKVRRAMNRFKTKVADLPIMWFHQQAKDRPEWELDKDEQDLLKDSIDTVFEVLDVEVEIEPLSWTLTSVWWVISYPVLAFVFLFLSKKQQTMDKEKDAVQQ